MARALLPLLTAEESEAALETSWMELLSSEVKPGPPELCKGFRAHPFLKNRVSDGHLQSLQVYSQGGRKAVHCDGILTRALFPFQAPQIFAVFFSCLSFPGRLEKLPEQEIRVGMCSWPVRRRVSARGVSVPFLRKFQRCGWAFSLGIQMLWRTGPSTHIFAFEHFPSFCFIW